VRGAGCTLLVEAIPCSVVDLVLGVLVVGGWLMITWRDTQEIGWDWRSAIAGDGSIVVTWNVQALVEVQVV